MPLFSPKPPAVESSNIYTSFFAEAKKERQLECIIKEINDLYSSIDIVLDKHDELGHLLNQGMMNACEFIVRSQQLKLNEKIGILARFPGKFKALFDAPSDQRLKILGKMCWDIESQSSAITIEDRVLLLVRDQYLKASIPRAKL